MNGISQDEKTPGAGHPDTAASIPPDANGAGAAALRQLLVATTVAISLLLGVTYFAVGELRDSYRSDISELLQSTLSATVSRVVTWHDEKISDLDVWSSSPELVAATTAIVKASARGETGSATAGHKKNMESISLSGLRAWHGSHYMMLAVDGGVISTNSPLAELKSAMIVKNPGIMQELLAGKTVMRFLPDMAPENHYIFYVAAPVSNGGNIIAFLVFELDPRDDFSEIISLGRSRSTLETYAFLPDGRMASESRFTAQLEEIGLVSSGQESAFNIQVRDPGGDMGAGFVPAPSDTARPLTVIARQAAGVGRGTILDAYRDYRGVDVIGSWQRLDEMGLTIATEIDYAEAFATMSRVTFEIILLCIISVSLVAGFSSYFHISRKKLLEAATRTRAVLDSAIDGMVVISKKGTVESYNPAAEKIFGYSEKEVIGRNVKMLMPEPFKAAHDGYLENYLTTGERKIIGIGREVVGRHKSGDVFPMDLSVSEMHLQGNRMFLGVVRNISERKKYEEDLLRSQETLNAAQRIAHLGSWSWDIRGGSLEWSDEIYRIFGLDPSQFDATYENFMGAIHPDDREMVQDAVNRSLAEKQPYSIEHRVIRPDGEIRFVHEQGELVVDENGTAIHMNGSVLDITEQKQSDMMKSEFVSTVSHELRTPLTSIHGSLGLLVGGAVGSIDEKAKKLLDVAFSSSDRLIRLINDILDAEKLEAGKMTFDIRSIPLDGLIDKTISLNLPYGEKFNIGISRVGGAAHVNVAVDADRFHQVMANLLSNAVKFSPDGGTVEVSTTIASDRAQIHITDHGSGIPEKFQDRIFQHFSQADSSDTRSKGGTGLGLSITKSIVEYMGGAIGFTTAEGQGTTFTFSLPIANGDGRPASEESNESGEAPGGNCAGGTILVCDNDESIGQFVSASMGDDCHVIVATNLAAARKAIAENEIHVVVLDVLLGQENGLDLLADIRKLESVPDVIIFTVNDEKMDTPDPVRAVMVKSRITHDRLFNEINKLLSQRAASGK